MPQVTVYVRDEDLDKWKAIEKKSEFLHRALTNGLQEPFRNQVINIKTGSVKDAGLDLKIPGEEEPEDDPYENLVIDTAAGRVADTELGEYIDSDPEMIKELKKRGQVR